MLKMNFKRDFRCGIRKAYVLQGLIMSRCHRVQTSVFFLAMDFSTHNPSRASIRMRLRIIANSNNCSLKYASIQINLKLIGKQAFRNVYGV